MQIIGMNYTINNNGERITTLHVAEEFNQYYTNTESKRGCVGRKVDSIYVGNYDCTNLKIGMDVEILYDKAVTTSRGTFQPVKRIEILAGK